MAIQELRVPNPPIVIGQGVRRSAHRYPPRVTQADQTAREPEPRQATWPNYREPVMRYQVPTEENATPWHAAFMPEPVIQQQYAQPQYYWGPPVSSADADFLGELFGVRPTNIADPVNNQPQQMNPVQERQEPPFTPSTETQQQSNMAEVATREDLAVVSARCDKLLAETAHNVKISLIVATPKDMRHLLKL